MAREKAQRYDNHARYVFMYHGVTFPLLLVNLVFAVAQVVRAFSWAHLVMAGTALALILLFFHARLFALTVQDRVIRLEERLRLERLLADPLRSRIPELTVDQLVGLRFAPDDEVAALVQAVFDEGLTRRDDIKKRVRNWRADHLRV